MRFSTDMNAPGQPPPHAGSLLLAHPLLMDPNFRRSVVLLSGHSAEEGSIGVIVNRPLGISLGQYESALCPTPLGSMPLYNGGPVACQQLILTAWKWIEAEKTFKFFFGIDEEKAVDLLEEDPAFHLRGFLGHAGWSEGQLEEEIASDSWLVSCGSSVLQVAHETADWSRLVAEVRPDLRLFADAPEDPGLN
jgi:putative transcriptional regulator